ncbi:TraB/VirB10 family protein [Herbaspirillum sp. RV1423]|uniref:TraB/VirB10 family protein n=1 Tax=Herbaspirillum sp. RV1423 TaxID=1443993 RepID=UPI0004ADC6DB|nr:TraB/VirB10 family protein [Herbaspirillum sp. RV1423]
MSFNLNEWIAKKKTEWVEMDSHFRWIIYSILICSPVLIYVRAQQHAEIEKHLAELQEKKNEKGHSGSNGSSQANSGGGAGSPADPANTVRGSNVLPYSYRNQGLETLKSQLDMAVAEAKKATQLSNDQTGQFKLVLDRLNKLETQNRNSDRSASKDQSSPANANAGTAPDSSSTTGFGLNQNLPGVNRSDKSADPAPVDFNQGIGNAPVVAPGSSSREMKSWGNEQTSDKGTAKKSFQTVSLPTNSGIESVMLTGINARSNASGSMPAGSVTSANNVGAPFVTRVKGEAILPNRFKVSLLNDCFISGSGVAVLSTEKAKVIADKLTCISATGEIFESKIKAYGVDLDGNEGISGRVVTKQGSILAKAALAGVASGIGQAFSPQGINGYNSNATSGQQGIQYANPSLVAQQGIYGGVNSSSAMLSKFYLDYAKEMFPVIEVDANTRITWILKETLDVPSKGR